MIIIQLAGGLGNQMFQYALYLQLKSLGKTVKIDDVSGFAQDEQRDQALRYFDIGYERPTAEELILMLDSSMLPWARVRRKLFGRKKKSYFEADKRYHPEIMEWDDIYLEGYWQTERYFAGVAQEVRAAYDIDRLLRNVSVHMHEYLSQINATESVSVHIRRGDYLLPENQKLFGGICTGAYYRSAMARMRREHPGCTFYIFTNDKQWIREQIAEAVRAEADTMVTSARIEHTDVAGEEVHAKHTDTARIENTDAAGIAGSIVVVDIAAAETPEQRDYAEFALMSKCRHHILANSSYSWWASYLCDHPDKTVLAPDRWLNGWDCTDIYREDMQKVCADDYV